MVDQLPLGADGEQYLDQAGAKQAFRRNRIAASLCVQDVQLVIHASQKRIHNRPQLAQRMVLRNALFPTAVTEQGDLGNIGAAHRKKPIDLTDSSLTFVSMSYIISTPSGAADLNEIMRRPEG